MRTEDSLHRRQDDAEDFPRRRQGDRGGRNGGVPKSWLILLPLLGSLFGVGVSYGLVRGDLTRAERDIGVKADKEVLGIVITANAVDHQAIRERVRDIEREITSNGNRISRLETLVQRLGRNNN